MFTASVALAALDTPSLSTGTSGHAKQTIYLTAGPSGAPYGFTIRWMDQATYLANGGQFSSTPSLDESSASFTGTPTLNTFGGEYTTFELGPNQTIRLEIGDLGDETGVAGTLSELDSGTRYYFAAYVNDSNGDPASNLSIIVNDLTTTSDNCTYTQGYWKNHPNAWPVSSLMLGSVLYSKTDLLSILNTSVEGNGLVSLAHQLIAAKLNIAQGADPTAVSAAIAAADALIGSLVVPPIGSGYLDPSITSMLTQTLDDYNNGITGPGHCGTVPARQTTWGSVKSLYR
ncbi:MAG TPA: hypothetical protein VFH88_00310 [Candidatus Krumholzibacteria bacterium]|nr:hypothetical protein [Candidatus Krumholzibacteria bacterium]